MEFLTKIYNFVMGPWGMFAVAVILFIHSEYMAMKPEWKSSGILDFIIKALKALKEKQTAPKV